MFEIPLEDVHRLLDTLEGVKRDLSSRRSRHINVEELGDLSLVLLEVLNWTRSAYGEKNFGINPSLLNKLVKLRGTILLRDAHVITERLQSYLRSEDQATPTVPQREPGRRVSRGAAKSDILSFKGEGWVLSGTTSENKARISLIASLLDTIVEQVQHSNAPPREQLLTEIERQQLIAILETALTVLRSPLIEKGLLAKTQSVLKRGAESAAEKGVQQGLGKLMEGAGARILELMGRLFS
jgi:hypothetical protein